MWVNSAKFENNLVTVTYVKFIPGLGWKDHTEYLETTPSGGWTSLEFDNDSTTTYYDFLNAMVVKNIYIKRRIAKLALDQALDTEDYTRIMNTISVLDPTFEPPIFNERARWQRELLYKIAAETSLVVISTCYNENRLEKYARLLMLV
jgi:hypothetical protein